jgi:hypothetical protein
LASVEDPTSTSKKPKRLRPASAWKDALDVRHEITAQFFDAALGLGSAGGLCRDLERPIEAPDDFEHRLRGRAATSELAAVHLLERDGRVSQTPARHGRSET